MRTKRQYFKDKSTTPEDFIRLAAAESIPTGKPYLVRTKEGEESRCDEWMKQV